VNRNACQVAKIKAHRIFVRFEGLEDEIAPGIRRDVKVGRANST
jgi:hypothetical protein